jgi:diacylglycerol kinase
MTNTHHQDLHFVRKRLKSFKYAFRGSYDLVKMETNARIHLIATIVVLAISFLLKINNSEWCIIIICIAMVWIAEAFNTAIEKLSDHVSPNYHRHIKKIKDLSAAGVLFSAIAAAVIAMIIFAPKALQVLQLIDN